MSTKIPAKKSTWCFLTKPATLFHDFGTTSILVSIRYSEVYQKIVMVTTSTDRQYGHSALILKMLCSNIQKANIMPAAMPPHRPSQNQRLNFAPASNATPIVIRAANIAMPIKEFGKPKTEPCDEDSISPQLIIGFMSQLGWNDGFLSFSILSIVRINEASNPRLPPIVSIQL